MIFEFFISTRYLMSQKKQAFISFISILSISGISLGVATLIVVIGVMTGTEHVLKDKILGVQPHLILMRYGESFTEYDEIVKKIKDINGIKAYSPFIYNQILLRSAKGIKGAVLKGIDTNSSLLEGIPDDFSKQKTTNDKIQIPEILLGKELAFELGAAVGDIIFIINTGNKKNINGILPKMKRARVSGLLDTGLYEYDKTFSYMKIPDAQELLNFGNAITGIDIWIDNLFEAKSYVKILETTIGWPYWARDWIQMNKNIFTSLKLQKNVMFIIFSLIVLVAGFSITSALIMMVIEKTKDISILKAMGATNKNIRKIFIINGLITGFIGILIGIGFGFVISYLLKNYQFIDLPEKVYFFKTLPVQLEILDILIISASALLICLISTLYPSHRAAKLNPVEGIRPG